MNWQKSLAVSIRQNELLKHHTTFKIGKEARFFIEPEDSEDLKSSLCLLRRYKTPILVIGAGSNILAGDKKLNKAVIHLNSAYFKRMIIKNNYLEAGAGSLLGRVVTLAKEHGLSGAEFFAGIPGTVGGALVMNAGCWGKDIGDLVRKVEVMDYNGKIKILGKKDINFSYRSSTLAKYIILKASFKLKAEKKEVIHNRIKKYFSFRRLSQDLSRPSAGCIFKNPAGACAGKLIDSCGLKGKRIGGAGISLKHANFILNHGNAKAADVLKLMELVKKEVKKKFKITLEPEIKIWR